MSWIDLRRRRRDIIAFIALLVWGSVVGYYIVQHQRLRIPFVEPKPHEVRFEMETAQAVAPGQGQTVRVAGIRVGDISTVELKNGRALITAELDESYDDLVRSDATAFLRPKTGLKDMFIELDPGTKSAPAVPEKGVVSIYNTLPDVNPDEVLAGLDADTRDYIKLLLNGAGRGLKDNGDDLNEVFRRFEPTYRDLAKVASAGAQNRGQLRRLVNSLRRVNESLASRDDNLAQLVSNASRVFSVLADEQANVAGTVHELAPTLRTVGATFDKVDRMARLLGPTADKLRPAIRSLKETNEATRPYFAEAAPLLRRDIRPFVRAARPFVRSLRPAAVGLARAEPDLTSSVRVLNHFFNLLGLNPNGREGPSVASRQEGYLFYLAWVGHQSANLFSAADAHGPLRPVTVGGSCATIAGIAQNNPVLEDTLGLTGVLTDPNVCG